MQPSGGSDERVKVNSGIVEFGLAPKSFQLQKVSQELHIPKGFAPPFVLVGLVHEDDDEEIKYMDEMILPNLCTKKFNIASIFDINADPGHVEELKKLFDNQQSENFFLMVKAFQITRSDFILGAFNFREGGSKTFKVIWYAGSFKFVPPVSELVTVPNVIGDDIELAKTKISNAELNPDILGDAFPGAIILTQSPAAPGPAQKHDKVTLTLGVRVPNVLRKTHDVADRIIRDAFLDPKFDGAGGNFAVVGEQNPEGLESCERTLRLSYI
jgi:hypothetical protein